MSSKKSRSESTDDTGSSFRDSGISVLEDLSESDLDSNKESEVKRRKYNRLKPEKNYCCAICDKKFGGGTDLRRHLLIHSNEKPHKCEICKKAYRQEVNLKNHLKIVHSKEKNFICPFCRKAFALKVRLRLHLRTHVGENPYSCPHCTETFARGVQLQHHLKTHVEHKRKTCDFCPSTFSSDRYFKLHVQRHGGGGIYKCQECKATFASEKSLKIHQDLDHSHVNGFECQICEKTFNEDMHEHMKRHTQHKRFTCEVCKAEFVQKYQYNIHMRSHTGERPYQCRVCWHSFGHTSVLKLHIRKHTGEKPFKCFLCKETHVAFSQLSHLKTHMKSIHSQDKAYVCEGCNECFKVKFQLDDHKQKCGKVFKETQLKTADKDAEALSRLRYLMAVLLKKISTEEKLTKLGFEKRLIDNVLIASLKLSNRKCYDNKKMNELERMQLNIKEFMEWIVPAEVMGAFRKECQSVENILDKIVTMYLEKVE